MTGHLYSVYSDPESLDARRRCGLALVEDGDTRGELILLAILPPQSPREERRVRELYARHLTTIKMPFHRSGVGGLDVMMVEEGFVTTLLLRTAPLGPLGPEWATVHTIELRGAPGFLVRPELAWVRRIIISSADVLQLACHATPLPFKSIVIDDHHDEATWDAFDAPAFDRVVEIHIQTSSASLPEGALRLSKRRPEIALSSGWLAPTHDPREL